MGGDGGFGRAIAFGLGTGPSNFGVTGLATAQGGNGGTASGLGNRRPRGRRAGALFATAANSLPSLRALISAVEREVMASWEPTAARVRTLS